MRLAKRHVEQQSRRFITLNRYGAPTLGSLPEIFSTPSGPQWGCGYPYFCPLHPLVPHDYVRKTNRNQPKKSRFRFDFQGTGIEEFDDLPHEPCPEGLMPPEFSLLFSRVQRFSRLIKNLCHWLDRFLIRMMSIAAACLWV